MNNLRSDFPTWLRPWPASEEKRYLQPGSAIRLKVTYGSESVLYEAEPADSYGAESRALVANISISPGVWRWPPPLDLPKLVLHPGVSDLKIEVIAVDGPLAGQSARLLIWPPLQFKKPKKDIGWVGILGLSVFWPFIIVLQFTWAALISIIRLADRTTHDRNGTIDASGNLD